MNWSLQLSTSGMDEYMYNFLKTYFHTKYCYFASCFLFSVSWRRLLCFTFLIVQFHLFVANQRLRLVVGLFSGSKKQNVGG